MPARVRVRDVSEELGEESDKDPSRSEILPQNESTRPLRHSSGSNASKRVRLSPNLPDDEASFEDSWALSTPNTTRPAQSNYGVSGNRGRPLPNGHSRRPRVTANRNTDSSQKWKPGQIVRVSLKNFVTYNSITFRPGPALNMIIGPNGTGKSTLVCAICIGLGWGTQHLGRAKELSEFIKHGCDEFEIIIELKGDEGKTNHEIQHNFKKDRSQKAWHINGKSVNHKEVRNLAAKLNIQVDNLCQFLPQDRVVEFSQLSGVDRLTSTQRAAAPQYMTDWYEQLKQLRASQKDTEKEQFNQKTNLINLESRQSAQRLDVERMRERAEVLQMIEDHERWIPMVKFRHSKKLEKNAKELKDTAQQELGELKRELEPAMAALTRKNLYREAVKSTMEERKKLCTRLEEEIAKYMQEVSGASDKLRENQAQRETLLKSDIKRKAEMARVRSVIDTFQSEKDNEPAEFEPAIYNEKSREQKRIIGQMHEQIQDIRYGQQEKLGLIDQRKADIVDAGKELENLASLSGRQENKLRKAFPEVAKAWEWIQENRNAFKGQVYGPPIVECSIRDSRYVNIIESLLQEGDFLTITCIEKEDFELLDKQLTETMGLKRITLRQAVYSMSDRQNQCPISLENMRELNLEGMAIDFLAGPDPVLSVLCESKKLHQTGVTLHEVGDEHYAKLEKSVISSWATGQNRYTITRRAEYGAAGQSTQVRQIQPAKWWTGRNFDTSREDEIKGQIAEWKSEIQEQSQSLEQEQARLRDLGQRRSEAEREKVRIEEEKASKQKAWTHYRSLDMKIESKERELSELQEAERPIKKDLREIGSEMERILFDRCEATIKQSLHVDMFRAKTAEFLRARLALTEAISDAEALTARHQDAQGMLDAKKNEFEKLEQGHNRIREESHRLKEDLRKIMAEDEDCFIRFNDRSEEDLNRTPDEHQTQIESLRAREELLHGGDPRAVVEFEDRARRIELSTQKIAENDAKLLQLSREINTLRTKWEPELDALVAKISTAFGASFEKIGCAGEVTVFKAGPSNNDPDAPRDRVIDQPTSGSAVNDNEFDNWAIHISVKFREGETLSLLDSHRQSGGERAVSTIFYLMALQQLSRAPFRVVDEINQGMDPRNERVVHERLVDLACGIDPDTQDEQLVREDESNGGDAQTSQYFLITPKLLDGLKYVPGMKVLNIISGEWVPENKTGMEMDFSKLAGIRKQIVTQRNHDNTETPLVTSVGA